MSIHYDRNQITNSRGIEMGIQDVVHPSCASEIFEKMVVLRKGFEPSNH